MAHPLARMKSCLPVKHSSGITKPLNCQTIFMKGGTVQLKVKRYSNHGKVSLMLIKTLTQSLPVNYFAVWMVTCQQILRHKHRNLSRRVKITQKTLQRVKPAKIQSMPYSHYCQSCWAVLLIWQGQIWLGLKMPKRSKMMRQVTIFTTACVNLVWRRLPMVLPYMAALFRMWQHSWCLWNMRAMRCVCQPWWNNASLTFIPTTQSVWVKMAPLTNLSSSCQVCVPPQIYILGDHVIRLSQLWHG